MGDVTRSSRSFGGRSVVVNTAGRSRAWSGKSGTAIVADLRGKKAGMVVERS